MKSPVDVVQLLQSLVAIPSVNPMGRNVEGEQYFEHRVTAYLESFFRDLEIPFVVQPVAPRRSNIIARLDGYPSPENGGQILLFEAHQDTVPVDGMTIEPWNPRLHEGRVYGRGACDVKGGMACMLTALSRIKAREPQSRPTLVVACTVDEEFAAVRGVGRLDELWTGAKAFLPRKPDAAIVAEPTLLDVVVAHKGALRWRCHSHGRAAHSSQPTAGDNAIYRMARVINVLERYAHDVVGKLAEHPRLGRPTLSVGVIGGGVSVNTVPDRCAIEIDRRLLPGDDPQEAYRHVADYLKSSLPESDVDKFIFDQPFLTSAALSDGQNRHWSEQVGAVARTFGDFGKMIGVNFGTDAPPLAACGIPTVVFGPGSIAQAHTSDEWIAVDQLLFATQILEKIVLQHSVPVSSS